MKHWQDGNDAANRAGKYAGAEHTPPNPHRSGTPEFAEWFLGFNAALRAQLGLDTPCDLV